MPFDRGESYADLGISTANGSPKGIIRTATMGAFWPARPQNYFLLSFNFTNPTSLSKE